MELRLVWISVLLFGVVCCFPVLHDYSTSNFAPAYPYAYYSGNEETYSQDNVLPYPNSYQAGLESQTSGEPVYTGDSSYSGPVYVPYYQGDQYLGYDYIHEADRPMSQRADSPRIYNAQTNYVHPGGYNDLEGSDFSNQRQLHYDDSEYPVGEVEPVEVFTDVSDLDPLYSISSRSSYQQGRRVFAQTRYTPLEEEPAILLVSGEVDSQAASLPWTPASALSGGGV